MSLFLVLNGSCICLDSCFLKGFWKEYKKKVIKSEKETLWTYFSSFRTNATLYPCKQCTCRQPLLRSFRDPNVGKQVKVSNTYKRPTFWCMFTLVKDDTILALDMLCFGIYSAKIVIFRTVSILFWCSSGIFWISSVFEMRRKGGEGRGEGSEKCYK